MPDLTKEERERIARAAGWKHTRQMHYPIETHPGSWWRRDVWLDHRRENDPPEVSTDELFALADRMYPNGYRLVYGMTLNDNQHRFERDVAVGYCSVSEAPTRRLALERAVLAGIDKQ